MSILGQTELSAFFLYCIETCPKCDCHLNPPHLSELHRLQSESIFGKLGVMTLLTFSVRLQTAMSKAICQFFFNNNSKTPQASQNRVFHSAANATSKPSSHYRALLPPSLRRLTVCLLCFPPRCYCNRLPKTRHSLWNSAVLCDIMLHCQYQTFVDVSPSAIYSDLPVCLFFLSTAVQDLHTNDL